jgi:hypothetical protein
MHAMKTNQPAMKIRRATLIFLAGIMIASCSEKSTPDRDADANRSAAPEEVARESEGEAEREGEQQPPEDKIGEDCLAFVRSTKVVPAPAASTDCPGCPPGGTEALAFRQMKTDSVSCSGDTCNIIVTIRAVFNRASGETLAGGLTAWIPPEQRSAYLSGQTPAGEQAYRIHVIYKRRGAAWRAVEFDRAPAE